MYFPFFVTFDVFISQCAKFCHSFYFSTHPWVCVKVLESVQMFSQTDRIFVQTGYLYPFLKVLVSINCSWNLKVLLNYQFRALIWNNSAWMSYLYSYVRNINIAVHLSQIGDTNPKFTSVSVRKNSSYGCKAFLFLLGNRYEAHTHLSVSFTNPADISDPCCTEKKYKSIICVESFIYQNGYIWTIVQHNFLSICPVFQF